jgi:hypothetical protein
VRALDIVHNQIRQSTDFMHAARWAALWRTVLALIGGRKLWLTALGRALPGAAMRKHAIKAVDRLLGNALLYRERPRVAAAIARLIIKRRATIVVLIDTVEIRHKVIGFVASVAHQGRSIPIWSTMTNAYKVNAAGCRAFLRGLHQVLPPDCAPILVTDGGFETDWFDYVERLGWDYVGRVRGRKTFVLGDARFSCSDLHAMAGRRAKNLPGLLFPITKPRARRLVLSKPPVSRHRRKKTRRGPDNDTNYRHYRKNAHEPLILTTSLSCNPQQVVDLYAVRMQIEQNFRDLKNHRWGWSLRHCRSAGKRRVELLLLIGGIATFVQHLAGFAGELVDLHHRYQANTVRKRRVLSFFVLGSLLLNAGRPDELTNSSLKRALARLRSDVSVLAAGAT